MGKKKKDKKSDKSSKRKKQSLAGKQPSPEKQQSALPAKMNCQEAVTVFRALSDENRMKILELLCEKELCTADLLKEVNVVQSTMSHHMKVLIESGLVSCRKEGKRSVYSIRKETVKQLETYLEHFSRK